MVRNKSKLTLFRIGNLSDYSYNHYVFKKEKKTFEMLHEIISRVFEMYLGEKDEKTDYTKEIDVLWSFNGISNSHLDLYIGKYKLFLGLHCSEKFRLKFNEELEKISIMPKYKHPKNLKKTKDKNLILGPYEHNKRIKIKKK